MTFFLLITSNDNAFDPKGPLKPLQCLYPQLSILPFNGHHRARRHLTLSPDPEDARVSKINTPLPVQRVEALHHIIRITGTGYCTFVGSKPGTFSPRDKPRHCPKPCVFSIAKCLGRRIRARLNTGSEDRLASSVGHKKRFRSICNEGACTR
jgi:hypothetical protein